MSSQTAAPGTPGPMLLGPGDPAPVGEINPGSRSRFLLICDHAGNAVPEALNGLGLGQDELNRHIGIDIGALGVATKLAARLSAPLIYQRYSRLVVDCNRMPHASSSMSEIADGTVVPGNAALTPADRASRTAEILKPYHDAITRQLDARAEAGLPTFLIAIHSFTPMLRATPARRPWTVGLCWATADRFSRHVLRALETEDDLILGRNQPYDVDMNNDYSIPVHGEGRGLPYAEFEIRQDLVGDPSTHDAWAERLARALDRAADSFEQEAEA